MSCKCYCYVFVENCAMTHSLPRYCLPDCVRNIAHHTGPRTYVGYEWKWLLCSNARCRSTDCLSQNPLRIACSSGKIDHPASKSNPPTGCWLFQRPCNVCLSRLMHHHASSRPRKKTKYVENQAPTFLKRVSQRVTSAARQNQTLSPPTELVTYV